MCSQISDSYHKVIIVIGNGDEFNPLRGVIIPANNELSIPILGVIINIREDPDIVLESDLILV